MICKIWFWDACHRKIFARDDDVVQKKSGRFPRYLKLVGHDFFFFLAGHFVRIFTHPSVFVARLQSYRKAEPERWEGQDAADWLLYGHSLMIWLAHHMPHVERIE